MDMTAALQQKMQNIKGEEQVGTTKRDYKIDSSNPIKETREAIIIE